MCATVWAFFLASAFLKLAFLNAHFARCVYVYVYVYVGGPGVASLYITQESKVSTLQLFSATRIQRQYFSSSSLFLHLLFQITVSGSSCRYGIAF